MILARLGVVPSVYWNSIYWNFGGLRGGWSTKTPGIIYIIIHYFARIVLSVSLLWEFAWNILFKPSQRIPPLSRGKCNTPVLHTHPLVTQIYLYYSSIYSSTYIRFLLFLIPPFIPYIKFSPYISVLFSHSPLLLISSSLMFLGRIFSSPTWRFPDIPHIFPLYIFPPILLIFSLLTFPSSDAMETSGAAGEEKTPSASHSPGFVTTGHWNPDDDHDDDQILVSLVVN